MIEALEGLEDGKFVSAPARAKLLRAQDHSGMIDCYISQVQNGKFVVKKRIPRAEMESLLPPRYDFRNTNCNIGRGVAAPCRGGRPAMPFGTAREDPGEVPENLRAALA